MGQLLRWDDATGTWRAIESRVSHRLRIYAVIAFAATAALVVAGGLAAYRTRGALKVKPLELGTVNGGIISRRELQLQKDIDLLDGVNNSQINEALDSRIVATRFKVSPAGFTPLHPPSPPIKQTLKVDLAIFGSELEGITTAIAAANSGLRVAIITDAPLGGIISDQSANLRYLDTIPGVPLTEAEHEVFKVLGVRGLVAVPAGVSRKLADHLSRHYAKQITVIKCSSLDNLKLESGAALKSVSTDQGVKVVAKHYLDMDPECRLGELAGLPMTVKTPELAYGLVFDLNHLNPHDYKVLQSSSRVSVPGILRVSNADWNAVKLLPGAEESKARFIDALHTDSTTVLPDSSYGYNALAEGYQFFMLCRQASHDTTQLRWLNSRRLMSGFNISHLGQEANLNSISYDIDELILQHCHSLRANPQLSAAMREEEAGLQSYFQYITGNHALGVRLPDELYVRRSTASIETLKPYSQEDFDTTHYSKWTMSYPMDFRGLTPRGGFDNDMMRQLESDGVRDVWKWNCRPSTCATKIPNLSLLNKCAVPPRFSGGLRIIQNLINTGQAWVEQLKP